MRPNSGEITQDVKKCVDDVINYVGKDIVFGLPLALGKPAMLVNELYRRAKEDPEINLKILSALALERPSGKSDLEKRFLEKIREDIFGETPEFEYMTDFRAGTMPPNVQIHEFYAKAGGYMNLPRAQQDYISSNYTHIVRDGIDNGINVFGELISVRKFNGKESYSMGCNTDICIEAIDALMQKRANGEKVAIIGEANEKLPYMYGDAVVESKCYDYILQGPEFNYELFGPPKEAVSLKDHMIGLNVSTLIKDGGTIQVGIGALGDAIAAALILRNEKNDVYQNIIEEASITRRYANLIKNWGGTGYFDEGLYGSSEMFVDPFMQMYKSNILKRKVFDSIPLMKLINDGYLAADNIPRNIIEKLLDLKAINPVLTAEDFQFLTEYGILKEGLVFDGDTIKDKNKSYSTDLNVNKNLTEIKKILGKELINGKVILGAFFIGPRSFYEALNDMSEDERKQFGMSGVNVVNQLYGDEELRRLQRKDGRFVNAGMIANVFGAITSDQIDDGRIVSGIGGQYNFVAMAHALHDGRAILMIRSTRGTGKKTKSNIVYSYGSCSVPKHLRDIIVTEYGIADVRGKSDADTIAAMINIADSRFQDELLAKAKKAGKIAADYEIPEEYRNNTPERIEALLSSYQKQGYLEAFPFGTDLTKEDIELGGALKAVKALSEGNALELVAGLAEEFTKKIPESELHHLQRMGLDDAQTLKEKSMQKMVLFALRHRKNGGKKLFQINLPTFNHFQKLQIVIKSVLAER